VQNENENQEIDAITRNE